RLGEIKICFHIVPVVRLGAAARNDRVVVVAENIRLRTIAIVEANLGKANPMRQETSLSTRKVRNVGKFSKQQRTAENAERVDGPVERRVNASVGFAVEQTDNFVSNARHRDPM